MNARWSTTALQQNKSSAASPSASRISRFSLSIEPLEPRDFYGRPREYHSASPVSTSRSWGVFSQRPQRKSIFEPIFEEGADSSADCSESPRLSPNSLPSDLENLEVYKRHHRPRAILTRTQSAPQLPVLISTNTTSPVYINHKR
ncbi:hypothetical protein C8Q75DRAFT_94439 [Abortiporus biennis]|nr:hypothetical protein C8Q75DRAFT_94439 [Abortiporus biennis]